MSRRNSVIMGTMVLVAMLAMTSSVQAELVITEIMSKSAHDDSDTNGDWWELTNTGASSVDLAGYSWDDDSGVAGTCVFGSVTIDAGETIIILAEAGSTEAAAWQSTWSTSVDVYTESDFTINGDTEFPGLGGGDGVYLFDASDSQVTVATYPDHSEGFSREWDSQGVSLDYSVDGENGAYTSSDAIPDVASPGIVASETVNLVITEVMSKSAHTTAGTDADWWELTNIGTSTINLNGLSWDDGHAVPGANPIGAVSIAGGESIIFLDGDGGATVEADWRTAWGLDGSVQVIVADFANGLGNGDEVYLYDTDDAEITVATYPEHLDGFSQAWDKAGYALGFSQTGLYGAYQSTDATPDVASPGTAQAPITPPPSKYSLVLNEYNGVSGITYLGGEQYYEADGDNNPAGDTVLLEDAYFASLADPGDPNALPDGRIQGNGNNWIELLVTKDHVDIRGWKLYWAEQESDTNGTDIWYGSGMVEQGIMTFSDDVIWSDLRRGTIITISEQEEILVDTDYAGDNRNFTDSVDLLDADVIIDLSTDTSYDPAAGDWWIHVSTMDELDATSPLITTIRNRDASDGEFGVGNDDWELRVLTDEQSDPDQPHFGPIGEGTQNWVGSGINSEDIGQLKALVPEAELDYSDYDDGQASTFGMANVWNDGATMQDLGYLRSVVTPPTSCEQVSSWGFGVDFDFNDDCVVDLIDFAEFSANWLNCIAPGQAGCDEPWLAD